LSEQTYPARGAGFTPFELRIIPRRGDERDEPPRRRVRTVPRGSSPARPGGRPVLGALAMLVFALGLWVQADRYADCRDAGGTVPSCLVEPW
jgi:hypothetical protein